MTKRCVRCYGTGHVGGEFYPRDCRICEGTGYVRVSTDSVRCESCKGTGEGRRTIWGRQPCSKCGSTGYAVPAKQTVTTAAD
jgi:DnaJ-class molecular chaperone